MAKVGIKQAAILAGYKSAQPKIRIGDVATVAAAMHLEKKLDDFRWRRPWVVKLRKALAWAFQYAAMGVCFFYTFIIALKFKEEATNLMVMSWVLAYGCTFAIVEPAQVILLSATPCLFVDTNRCGRCCLRMRFVYNELLSP